MVCLSKKHHEWTQKTNNPPLYTYTHDTPFLKPVLYATKPQNQNYNTLLPHYLKYKAKPKPKPKPKNPHTPHTHIAASTSIITIHIPKQPEKNGAVIGAFAHTIPNA